MNGMLWKGFTVYVPRLVAAATDALRAALAQYGDSYRLREIHEGDTALGFEFGPAVFVQPAVAGELQSIVMGDGETREDEYFLTWELATLPSFGDLLATFERLAAFKSELVVGDIDTVEELSIFIVDPFAVPPGDVLFGYELAVSTPLGDD